MTARTVPASLIRVREGGQDREHFDQSELEDLARSIAANGLLYPPIVREVEGSFELVAGERRTRAMRDVLGWDEIPVDVRELSDEEAARAMLVENVNRVDLDPMAEARAYADRIERFDATPARIASECGIPAARVRDRLKLLALSEHVAHYVATKQLPLRYAACMVALDHNRQALALAAYHERPIGVDAFRAVCGRLLDEQEAENASGLFESADFLRVEEWAREEEELVRLEAEPVAETVREHAYGLEESAELVGLSVAQLRAMLRKGAFPEPDLSIGRRPAWWAGTVTDWAADEGRALPVRLEGVA